MGTYVAYLSTLSLTLKGSGSGAEGTRGWGPVS